MVAALKGPIRAAVELGEFVPKYHKDRLYLALGTKEHGGRVRGVSSSCSWKEGFSSSSSETFYKKHTLYKEDLEQKGRNEWRRQFVQFFADHQQGSLSREEQAAIQMAINAASSSSTQQRSTEIEHSSP